MTDVAAPTSQKTDRERAPTLPKPSTPRSNSSVWLPAQKENSPFFSTTTTPPVLLLSLIDFFSFKSVHLSRPLSPDDLFTGRLHFGTHCQNLQENPTVKYMHGITQNNGFKVLLYNSQREVKLLFSLCWCATWVTAKEVRALANAAKPSCTASGIVGWTYLWIIKITNAFYTNLINIFN